MLPVLTPWFHVPPSGIEALRAGRDVRGLARLLGNRHTDVQWRAAEALATLGPAATGDLVRSLSNPRVPVRLGALEALSAIRDPAALPPVIESLEHDPNSEVRWAAAIALGQIGDPVGIPPLVRTLASPDKLLRFGTAQSLRQLGWIPEEPAQEAALAFAFQDWAALRRIGRPAIPVLLNALADTDRDVRTRAIEILGEMRAPEIHGACDRALADGDAGVRWRAVMASKKCGMPALDLPLYVSRRPRTRPNPFAAAILNLFFLGLGYNYLGKWWGFLIFMSYMTIMVILSIEVSLSLPFFNIYPNLYSYPVTAVFAYQTYLMARNVPDL